MKVGQTVICVDDSGIRNIVPQLKKGNKYVINQIRICDCGHISFDVGLLYLPEIMSTFLNFKCTCGKESQVRTEVFYRASRFRVIEPEYRVVEIAKEVKQQQIVLN